MTRRVSKCKYFFKILNETSVTKIDLSLSPILVSTFKLLLVFKFRGIDVWFNTHIYTVAIEKCTERIDMEKARQPEKENERKKVVRRRWVGRWSRHWFLLVFIDHVPSLLGRLYPLTEILARDRKRAGIEEERHISYFISRTAWIFFRIFKARARITRGYQSDLCFSVAPVYVS